VVGGGGGVNIWCEKTVSGGGERDAAQKGGGGLRGLSSIIVGRKKPGGGEQDNTIKSKIGQSQRVKKGGGLFDKSNIGGEKGGALCSLKNEGWGIFLEGRGGLSKAHNGKSWRDQMLWLRNTRRLAGRRETLWG